MTTPIEAAMRDPEGARVALLAWGEIAEWPELRLGFLWMKGGEQSWRRAVRAAPPLWLGTAWQKIEEIERQQESPIGKPKLATAKEKTVPVLQWTEPKVLDPGAYPVIITDITEEDGQFGPQLRFQFVVLDSEGKKTDDEIRGYCSAKWGPKTKLYEWAKAILKGKLPGPGEPFDTDELKGRKCDILVEAKPGQNGQVRSVISALYPYRTVSVEHDDELPVN